MDKPNHRKYSINLNSKLAPKAIAVAICGIISKIKVLHLKIKVYMKNVAVFTH